MYMDFWGFSLASMKRGTRNIAALVELLRTHEWNTMATSCQIFIYVCVLCEGNL